MFVINYLCKAHSRLIIEMYEQVGRKERGKNMKNYKK